MSARPGGWRTTASRAGRAGVATRRLPTPAIGPPLLPAFFDRPAEAVARDLLGCVLVSELDGGRAAGIIVETEAYTGPEDPACHAAASIGRTQRNDPLFGPPGRAYVHMNYGIHWLLNAVTGPEGRPAGVLLRALEPLQGEELMRRRRGRPELTSGPARLARAMGVGPELQRHPLHRPPLWIAEGEPAPTEAVVRAPRVGISRGTELPLRFYDARSRWVSRR